MAAMAFCFNIFNLSRMRYSMVKSSQQRSKTHVLRLSIFDLRLMPMQCALGTQLSLHDLSVCCDSCVCVRGCFAMDTKSHISGGEKHIQKRDPRHATRQAKVSSRSVFTVLSHGKRQKLVLSGFLGFDVSSSMA